MPRAGRGGNHCVAAEIEPSTSETPGTKRKAPSAPETTDTRLHADDVKVAILNAYACWVASGSKFADCPNNDIVANYGCNRKYAKDRYDLVMRNGTTD